jgi:hypothetical protein
LALYYLLERLQRHLEAVFLRQVMTDATFDVACGLAGGHGLFALDAVQLAGYLDLRTSSGSTPAIFVSADRQLLEAAEAELAPVLDPCSVRS